MTMVGQETVLRTWKFPAIRRMGFANVDKEEINRKGRVLIFRGKFNERC